jgi:hypothetical protein
MTRRPPRVAIALLRHFGPQDDALAGDLLERFQRRSSSKLWYWWQVGIAIRLEAVREVATHPIAVWAAVMSGWVAFWVLLYGMAFPGLFTGVHAYFMWRMFNGHDALLFGPFFVYMSWVLTIAAEVIGAVVAVRVYRGHRSILALLYAVAVFPRWIAHLTLNSIYYDPTANPLRYSINVPPLNLYLLTAQPFAALFGGMWAASRQPPAKHISSATDMPDFGGHFMGESVKCAVCGKPIGADESRLVDVAKGTKVHIHMECKRKG